MRFWFSISHGHEIGDDIARNRWRYRRLLFLQCETICAVMYFEKFVLELFFFLLLNLLGDWDIGYIHIVFLIQFSSVPLYPDFGFDSSVLASEIPVVSTHFIPMGVGHCFIWRCGPPTIPIESIINVQILIYSIFFVVQYTMQ